MSALDMVGRRLAEAQDRLIEADARQLARVRARVLAPPPRRVPLGRGVALARQRRQQQDAGRGGPTWRQTRAKPPKQTVVLA